MIIPQTEKRQRIISGQTTSMKIKFFVIVHFLFTLLRLRMYRWLWGFYILHQQLRYITQQPLKVKFNRKQILVKYAVYVFSGVLQPCRNSSVSSQQVHLIAHDQPFMWQAPFNTETQIQHDVHPSMPRSLPLSFLPLRASSLHCHLRFLCHCDRLGFINSVKHHTENVGHKRGWLLPRHLWTAQWPQAAACGTPALLDRQGRKLNFVCVWAALAGKIQIHLA